MQLFLFADLYIFVVTVFLGDDLVPWFRLGSDGGGVAHRSRWHKQPRLLVEHLSHAILQIYYCGVITENIVANDGGGHSLPHGWRWLRDRVAA